MHLTMLSAKSLPCCFDLKILFPRSEMIMTAILEVCHLLFFASTSISRKHGCVVVGKSHYLNHCWYFTKSFHTKHHKLAALPYQWTTLDNVYCYGIIFIVSLLYLFVLIPSLSPHINLHQVNIKLHCIFHHCHACFSILTSIPAVRYDLNGGVLTCL